MELMAIIWHLLPDPTPRLYLTVCTLAAPTLILVLRHMAIMYVPKSFEHYGGCPNSFSHSTGKNLMLQYF